ncbi:MAG: hypothetical protein NTX38_03455 [Methylobacter sp.]|nr:hypothetical protein [Methylobacter sp.]
MKNELIKKLVAFANSKGGLILAQTFDRLALNLKKAVGFRNIALDN